MPKPPHRTADHAHEHALAYHDRLDEFSALLMEEMGVPSERIGCSDWAHGVTWQAFNPHERTGGGVDPGGRIVLDSGIFNPNLMKPFGCRAHQAWRHASVKARAQAVVVHEFIEGNGVSHEEAIRLAPNTELNISHEARELLRRIRDGFEKMRGK